MRFLLVLAFLYLPVTLGAQVRVALDFSTRGNQMLPTFLFLKVVKYRYYVKTGFSVGTFGAGEKEGEIIGSGAGWMNNEYKPIVSSFRPMNFPEDTMAKLVYYKERNSGVSLEGGFGRFFEFGEMHTLRFDLQFKTYFLRSKVIGDYDPLHNSGKDYSSSYRFFHFALSIGPEVFHAIRFSPRLTGYYGFKVPLYMPFESKNYERLDGPSPIKGIKPFITFGMSCAIGKTEEKE